MNLNTIDAHFHNLEEVDNIPIDREVLHLLAKNGELNAEELQLAYHKSALYPKKKEWLHLGYRFFMGAGLLLVLSGIVFFFAYNWSGLHKFAKLGLVQIGILAISILLLSGKLSEFTQKLGLTAISVLVGIAFAVFGQIYQTGADAYDFFLGWTLFITAWVAIASFPFLWLFYLILVNTTLVLYFYQVKIDWSEDGLFFAIAILNTIALAIWEYCIKDNRMHWVHLLSTRLIGAVVLMVLTSAVFRFIWKVNGAAFSPINGLLYLLVIASGSFYYIQKRKDIAFVAMVAISLLAVGNMLVIRVMDTSMNDLIGIFFILGFANIAATVVLVRTLINTHRKWNSPLNQKIEANYGEEG